MKQLLLVLSFLSFITINLFSNNLWNDVTGQSINTPGERMIIPQVYKTFQLDLTGLKLQLQYAPHESNVKARNSEFIISIPMPDGSLQRFRIVEYSMMEQGLADKFPGIKTYLGEGADDRSLVIRLDVTYAGFHAMMFTNNGDVFIDPYTNGSLDYYNVYYKKDYTKANDNFDCTIVEDEHSRDHLKNLNYNLLSSGENLRTYRLALACTGEYAAVFGGTVPNVLSEMATCMNRVNGVYEKDVSARMILVANNNMLVYTNASTDPYTNNNGTTMLGQNQTTCDNVIGTANYDIGHVFSTGGGGVAGLGVICRAGQKARGVTGLPSPIGDPFYIDYVAHEMGHEFGANHPFNSITSNCGGGNRNASTAYEPGSGSTIMGYAGICGSDDLQAHSDAYFHVVSFNEIRNYISVGLGNGCAVITATGNSDPTVTVPAGDFFIPKSTPFSLTGTATDPQSDPLVYCWEEFDLGPGGAWNAPVANAPIFRSFNPVSTGFRTFPKLANLLNNTVTVGEILPSYGRNLTFRLTARDNRAGGGGSAWSEILFHSDNNSGPFLVTFPNTNVTIGGVQNITWDVANTTASPVSCSNVNILLSTDGGNTFPTTLAANTPNDGSQNVTLPSINNNQARIKVESIGNIFFDISNANFTIDMSTGVHNLIGTPIEFSLSQNYPNPFNPTTMLSYAIPKKAAVTMKIYDVTGKLVQTLINSEVKTEGYYSIEFDASNLPSGVYYYSITAGDYKDSKKMILIK